MKIIKVATQRPIGACMLFIVFIVFGVISLQRLKVSLLPDITFPRLTIITIFQNVPPSEIENLVTSPIEEAIMSVKGVKRVESISRQGISIVVPVFKWGTNIDVASVDVREKLDMIRNILPQDVGKPIISRIDPSSSPIIGLGVFWKNRSPVFIKNLIEKEIKPELERIDGVAKVSVKGGVEEEITVSVDLDRLASYQLALPQVLENISSSNYNFPAGNIVEGKAEYLIRVDGEFKGLGDIQNTIIGRSKSGAVVLLSDIAKVSSGTKERTSYFLLNGKEGIGLEIIKENSANDIDISGKIKEKILEINDKFGSFLKVSMIYDSSDFIKEAINGLFISASLAILITFFVVFVFMKNLRLPLIIIITVPISILITFILMYLTGMTLNIMSLGGLALGIGMLVDSSIVVIEEIEGKKERNDIYKSASRVAFSIFASTLTTLVVFIPLIFVKGIAGSLFGQLALTISFSLISSILVSLVLIPVLYILIAPGQQARDPVWFAGIKQFFKKLLGLNLRKKIVIFAVCSLFFASSILVFIVVRKEFMPVVDRGEFFVKIAYKNGTPIEESRKLTEAISQRIMKEKSVKHTFASIGFDTKDPFALLQEEVGVHIAEIRVVLDDNRKDSVFTIVDRISKNMQLREEIKVVFEVPRNIISDVLNLEKADYSVELFADEKENLDPAAQAFMKELEESGLFIELETSKKAGKPQIKVSFDQEALAGSGISAKSIYDIMATAIKGKTASAFRRDDDQIDIKVILEESDRSEFQDISRLTLASQEGQIPIFPFLKHIKITGPSKILRKNQKEYIKISGNYIRNDRSSQDKIAKLQQTFLSSRYGIEISGGAQMKETKESFDQLRLAFLLSIFLVYALLAAQFESLFRPFLIMFSVPLSFFGSLFLLFILGKSINLNSIIGIVMLTGIVVNNSIILFDRYNYNINRLNWKPLFSVYAGSIGRFKPVLMTSFTTIIGLVPMAIGIGRGGELQSSLALSVIGGLFISTVLTLFLMPNLYHITAKPRGKKR